MAQTLTDYQEGKMTVEEIAANHGISTATITIWAKKAGLTLRQRGRRTQREPTPRQMEIVKLASVYTQADVGARFGMHKQSVNRIVKRWGRRIAGALPRKPPFDPGDIIRWRGKLFTVLDANHLDGVVCDEQGRFRRNFKWRVWPVPLKIGFNPRYVVLSATPVDEN